MQQGLLIVVSVVVVRVSLERQVFGPQKGCCSSVWLSSAVCKVWLLLVFSRGHVYGAVGDGLWCGSFGF